MKIFITPHAGWLIFCQYVEYIDKSAFYKVFKQYECKIHPLTPAINNLLTSFSLAMYNTWTTANFWDSMVVWNGHKLAFSSNDLTHACT